MAFVRSRKPAQKATVDWWAFARQMAFMSANRHDAYSRLMRDWEARNPAASWTEHEQAASKLAKVCGV